MGGWKGYAPLFCAATRRKRVLQVAVLEQLTLGQPKELVVGATETFIRFYMPEALKAFRKENPGIHVTFKGATTPDLCKLLEAVSL